MAQWTKYGLNKSKKSVWIWKIATLSAFLLLSIYFLSLSGYDGFGRKQVEIGMDQRLKLHPLISPSPIGSKFVESKNNNDDENLDDLLYETTLVQENFETLEQTDPKLIRYVRARYMTPPPPSSKPYNLKNTKYEKTPFGKWVRDFYKDKRNGVFLEAGANDGESSNTIELEKELGWSGVLVECNPKVTPDLRNSGRKAWLATVCLSTNGYPQVVNMSIPTTWAYSARLGPAWDLSTFGVNSNWSFYDGIETVPLYSILASIGIKEIDYFSFDIEGLELNVLKYFPFDKILIKVLILEVHFYTPIERLELKNLLQKNKLRFIKGIQMDEIYVHESLSSGLDEAKLN